MVSLALAGCFGDPPPDPRTAPLEVVVGSLTRPDQPCILNRDEVRSGAHEVSVIVERGPAVVRIIDSDDTILIELAAPSGAVSTGPLQLPPGDYKVECVADDGTATSVALSVTN